MCLREKRPGDEVCSWREVFIRFLGQLQRKKLLETKNRTLKCLKWHYSTVHVTTRAIHEKCCSVNGGRPGYCPLFSLRAVWIDSYINFTVDTVQQNSNLHAIHTFAYITFIFYLYSFFIAPVEDLCCKPKYRANAIHHSIFFLPIFFLSLFLP